MEKIFLNKADVLWSRFIKVISIYMDETLPFDLDVPPFEKIAVESLIKMFEGRKTDSIDVYINNFFSRIKYDNNIPYIEQRGSSDLLAPYPEDKVLDIKKEFVKIVGY